MGRRVDAMLAIPRRLRASRERLLYPEASGALDQWQRVVLYDAVDQHLATLETSELRAAEISGDTYASRDWREYESLNFPDFDLCEPLENPDAHDLVICEQVLEHVIDPWRAAANLRDLVVPGGCVIVSTPFLIKVHELPMYAMRDYWRFTPRGLRALLEQAGLNVDRVDAWGNRECIVGNLERWSSFRRWHSLRNEPDLAVQVWAFAHRPA